MKRYCLIFLMLSFFTYCSQNINSTSSDDDNQLDFTPEELIELKNIVWNDLTEIEKELSADSTKNIEIQNGFILQENNLWYYKGTNQDSFNLVIPNTEVKISSNQRIIIATIDTGYELFNLGPWIVLIEPNTKFVLGRGILESNGRIINFVADKLLEFGEIAWNDLSADEKKWSLEYKDETIIEYGTVCWDNGTWNYKYDNYPNSFVISSPSMEITLRNNQRVVIVTFKTGYEFIDIGPWTVIIEPFSASVIGRGVRPG